MGNQTSKHHDNLDHHLDHFTDSELKAIDATFSSGSLASPNTVSRDTLQNGSLSPLAPPLRGALISYFQLKSTPAVSPSATQIPQTTPITKLGFISAVYLLSKAPVKDRAGAFYDIFSLSSVSFEELVKQVSQPAIKYWFEGSELDDILINDPSLHRLVHHLLVAFKTTTSDDDLFLPDPPTDTLAPWIALTRATPPSSRPSRQEITDWYTNTPTFAHLITILVSRLFLTSSTHFLPFSDRRPLNLAAPHITPHFSEILTPPSYFLLAHNLPADCRLNHTRIFSSRHDGNSWQAFTDAILEQGSTLIVIQDKDGNVFGAFAYEEWNMRPKFYGDTKNFLFTVVPELNVFPATTVNANYQYLNFGTKSLPNGIGLGGQMDYFGLWISADFEHGHSRAAPHCTTYASPKLAGKEEFIVDEVEVWLFRPTPKDPDLLPPKDKRSALDHDEHVAFLELGGRKMHGKHVREQDAREDKERALNEGRV
ncbi:TLD-domain-containing protein [Jimgerdemannia flammicorona]|uniref:MTOR-associated protein MEAK7 n=1 Tax=Jimgerdemannia flammicorona TaxID=994334 RepID=A0A433DMM4_9FUNG|nr:TLD-domain-containing protein [Jimgerdemannia flammicorona]